MEEVEEIKDSDHVSCYISYDLPDGFDIYICLDVFEECLKKCVDDFDLLSLYDTLPHEILHAIDFYIEADGMTPLEIFDNSGINGLMKMNRKIIESRYGDIDSMEEAIEEASKIVTSKVMSKDILEKLRMISCLPEKQIAPHF